ncbi:MAG: hypothetical protein ABJ263_17125 [Tateyamaria sp.]|uniref:hypothetical protein n=1 Tax=Tateyamaria sp. TaxID=1929288 RepID=UPI00326DA7AF
MYDRLLYFDPPRKVNLAKLRQFHATVAAALVFREQWLSKHQTISENMAAPPLFFRLSAMSRWSGRLIRNLEKERVLASLPACPSKRIKPRDRCRPFPRFGGQPDVLIFPAALL